MTNEEAIEIIKAYKDRLTSSCSNQLNNDIEAFNLAIKALEDVERLEDENCRIFVNSQHIISSLVAEIKKLRGKEE